MRRRFEPIPEPAMPNDREWKATPLRVALGEYDTAWHDPAASLDRASALVERAAAGGAELVAFPEMCTTGFTMQAAAFAEAEDGPGVRALADLARRHDVAILAGLALRSSTEPRVFHNSAMLFDRDGAIAGVYRKQRLFGHGGEDEHYVAGTEPVLVRLNDVVLAPFICYDLRFPELFRPVAPGVDLIVLLANWPASRRQHWDVLVRARAIENQCYVVAINRIGTGDGVAYDGGSVAYDPWGELVAASSMVADDRGPAIAYIDPAVVTQTRRRYPFVVDERDRAVLQR